MPQTTKRIILSSHIYLQNPFAVCMPDKISMSVCTLRVRTYNIVCVCMCTYVCVCVCVCMCVEEGEGGCVCYYCVHM